MPKTADLFLYCEGIKPVEIMLLTKFIEWETDLGG